MRVKCRDGSMTTWTKCHRGWRDTWRVTWRARDSRHKSLWLSDDCHYDDCSTTTGHYDTKPPVQPTLPAPRQAEIFIEKYLNILYPNVPMETAARGRWLRVSIIAGTVIMQLQFLCFPDRGVPAVHCENVLDLTWTQHSASQNRHIQPEWVARWIMQNPVVQIQMSSGTIDLLSSTIFFRSTACFSDVQCPDQFCISNGWLLQHKNRGGLHFEEEEEAGTKVNFIVNKDILSCIYFVPP